MCDRRAQAPFSATAFLLAFAAACFRAAGVDADSAASSAVLSSLTGMLRGGPPLLFRSTASSASTRSATVSSPAAVHATSWRPHHLAAIEQVDHVHHEEVGPPHALELAPIDPPHHIQVAPWLVRVGADLLAALLPEAVDDGPGARLEALAMPVHACVSLPNDVEARSSFKRRSSPAALRRLWSSVASPEAPAASPGTAGRRICARLGGVPNEDTV